VSRLSRTFSSMQALRSTPGALRLFAISVVARLPLAMLSIALLVHTEHLTDSFAAAGAVDGSFAVSLAVGGPLLGRLVDRGGQTRVLAASAAVATAALVALATRPVGSSLVTLAALAVAVGLATPPLGACLRTLLSALVDDPDAAASAYALDATAIELTWIFGPLLAVGLATIFSTALALAAAGAVLLTGTLAFAIQPASRGWRPSADERTGREGALRPPVMRTLVIALLAVGAVTGSVQVGVAAATDAMGQATAAGPLLGLWGAGSLLGGLLASRLGSRVGRAGALTLFLAALTVGHLAMVAATSVVALGALLMVAGASIAPTYASVYVMADRAAPAGAVTEAFSWLATAAAVGGAAGAALAGSLVEQAGFAAAFGLAGVVGSVAVICITVRMNQLPALRRASWATSA
jgi:MFS family permease